MINYDEKLQLVHCTNDSSETLEPFGLIQTPECFELVKTKQCLFERPDYYIRYNGFQRSFPYVLSEEDRKALHTDLDFCGACINKWERVTGKGPPIDLEKALDFVPFEKLTKAEECYKYWRQRRLELGHPLLREFWLSETTSDSNLKRVFCNPKGNKMTLREKDWKVRDKVLKLQSLYNQLREVKEILNWTLKREFLKKYIVSLKTLEFQTKCLNHKHPYSELVLSKFSSLTKGVI